MKTTQKSISHSNLRSLNYAEQFYHLACATRFPNPACTNQFQRALLSVPLNLAEGNSRRTSADRRNFFYTALASLREVQCILRLHNESTLLKHSDILGAMIYKLCKSLE